MNKRNVMIWGRNFDLPINYKILNDGSMTKMQTKAIETLLSNEDIFDEIKKSVDEYVVNNSDGLDSVDNIFKYVIPKCFYIPGDESGSIVGLMCNFKFDMEHGLAIMFENGKMKKIGSQDIML